MPAVKSNCSGHTAGCDRRLRHAPLVGLGPNPDGLEEIFDAPYRRAPSREMRVIQPLREISTTTRRLSAYIAGALAQPLPQAVIERTRQHILDTLAAMISGAQLRPGRL